MPRLLHLAAEAANPNVWNEVFRRELSLVGELVVLENGNTLSDDQRAAHFRETDIAVTSWGAAPIPKEIALQPGKLRYVCHVTGEMRWAVPLELIDAGIPVTNWGDFPANRVAEGAMALLLAVLKDLHPQIQSIRRGEWRTDPHFYGGSLEELNVGVYGLGVIGRRFIELLRPFRSLIRIYDPYAREIPPDCERVETLPELFQKSQAVVVHAALTDETRRSVNAELLALLPRHGIIINTARGDIIDQDALFAELTAGRLRAGLDVTVPEPLPPDHPIRQCENVILSAHRIEYGWPDDGVPATHLNKMQSIALDNLKRFLAGKPLLHQMNRERYLRST